jgi:hypothetical protein
MFQDVKLESNINFVKSFPTKILYAKTAPTVHDTQSIQGDLDLATKRTSLYVIKSFITQLLLIYVLIRSTTIYYSSYYYYYYYYTWNITHNTESTAVWKLKPERWGLLGPSRAGSGPGEKIFTGPPPPNGGQAKNFYIKSERLTQLQSDLGLVWKG